MANPPEKSEPIRGPVATIVRKRSFLVPALITLLLVILIIAIYTTRNSQDTSDILVTVNGEPIYRSDIEREYTRLPAQYQAQLSRESLVNQTIDKMLLLQEARERGITVTDEQIQAYIDRLLGEFGISEPDLKLILGDQNLSLPQYKVFVQEELLLSAVVQEAVVSKVSVSEKDIVNYYESNLDEFTAPADGAVVSVITTNDKATADSVIVQLEAGESFDELAAEYSVDSTASDGGYVGIVSSETQLPKAFIEAATKLNQDDHSKTPLDLGTSFIVIYRHGDVESLRHVRSRIENQLKVQQQITEFQRFLDTLRSSAKITYYTEQGKVTKKPTIISLDGFATCVAGKATLYGTDWSDFLIEQKTLFGDSFDRLNYVDCDEQPRACSEANIQKYPTWVIGDEREGSLSLEELSEKTDCNLP